MTLSSAQAGEFDQSEVIFLIEKNADGIIVVDEQGSVVFANPAAHQIFGRTPETLIGTPIGLPLVIGDTSEITILKPGGGQADAEIRVVETTWNGQRALLASLRDISERRTLEERLRHSAKMEALGRLTAGVAHDFNNHLTVVMGNLESALRRHAGTNDPLSRILENAMRGAKQAASLTERLLAFARRKPLEPRRLELNGLVGGMSDLLRRTLGEGIEVHTKLDADLWPVEADPTELETAILNLAVNARDAIPAGGKLIIETANANFDAAAAAVRDLPPGPYVMIGVTDTGTGMAPEVLRQAFEPFFTTKADGHGTGLGLSQVYGFVKQSGGEVKIYSEPGLGTTVRIYLPRAVGTGLADAGSGPATRAEPVPGGRPSERILVVEDNPDVRAYAVSSLREIGYSVLQASDAASALQILATEPPIDLLFTDLGLPGGQNGKALADAARRRHPALQVLITTAYAGAALIHHGRLDPGIDLLSKPFSYADLAARVRALLDRRAQHRTRVLLVEDETLAPTRVAEMLSEVQCEVEEAASFREAAAKIDETLPRFSAAIIDADLPNGRGDQLVAHIRAAYPDLPIVLTTRHADHRVQAEQGGADNVRILTKPFEPDFLVATLRSLGVRIASAGAKRSRARR